MEVMLGPEIKLPLYTPDQAEIWVDLECPSYTGIMAAVNGIAFKRHVCYIDSLSEEDSHACFVEAGKISMAWIELPPLAQQEAK